MRKTAWLLLINSTNAKIYEISRKDYTLIHEMDDPKGRYKTQEFITDKPGRYKTDIPTQGKFAMPYDPHQTEQYIFVKSVAHFLNKAQEEKKYEHLILCAEPHMHGLFNKAAPKNVQSKIIRVLEKDFLPFPKDKLNKTIQGMLNEII